MSTPKDPNYQDNYLSLHSVGVLKGQLGDWLGGIELIKKALILKPEYAEAHSNLGYGLTQLKRYEEALPCFERAVALKPQYPEAYYNWGIALEALKRYKESVACYKKAVAYNPNYYEAYNNCGSALVALKRFEEALQFYKNAIELKSDHPDLYSNYGSVLHELGRYEEAVECYEKALELKSTSPGLYNNYGNLLREVNRFDEAIIYFQSAIKLKPDYAAAYNNYAVTLQAQQRYEEAIKYYDHAFKIDPTYYDAPFNKSLLYLALGRFEEGWPRNAGRWRKKDAEQKPATPYPLWSGESLKGKSLLIVAEQGMGDQLQMLRYIPMLEKMGAKCLVYVDPPLQKLAKRSFSKARILSSLQNIKTKIDCCVCIMSLPLLLKTFSEDEIPHNCPYLVADKNKVKSWNKKLHSKFNLKVGVVWKGRSAYKNNRKRSIPLETISSLFMDKRIQFVLLQHNATQIELDLVERYPNVLSISEDLKDFDDTAAAIMALDLVISVDTAVAHLAGALNKSVLVMLPYNADWRWLINRSDSPWYPSSRLFRQKSIGNWTQAIEEVKQVLGEALGDKKL